MTKLVNSPQPRNPQVDCQFALEFTTSSPGLTHLASRHISSRITVFCADVCYYSFVGLRFLANLI